ncbi:MAG: branched-chain amino acid ABC transporter permease, partial [Acidimicrobiales bacterium]
RRFFEGDSVQVGDLSVSYHSIAVLLIAVGVAVGLWVVLNRTRLGIAMRAVVDDRELSRLNGINPDRTSSMAWGLGCSLAALAGICISPILQLDVVVLTLLVINAYAAAMVGRLRSLPLTFLGALILGLVESYANYATAEFPDQTGGWRNSSTPGPCPSSCSSSYSW